MVGELTTIDPDIDVSAPPAAARLWHDPIRAPLAVFACSRVVVLVCAVVATVVVDRRPERGPWPTIDGAYPALLRAFGRWDGAWYLEVAAHGYRPITYGSSAHASAAFFPGYPAFVHVVAVETHLPLLVAAIAVSAVFGAGAAIALWHVVDSVAGPEAASRGVALFWFSPGAFALSLAYSEAMFVAAAAACLLMLLRERWWLAGAAGFVACITRPSGFALVVACVAVAAVAARRDRAAKPFVAPALAALGSIAALAYLAAATGRRGAWFEAERDGWGDRVAPLAGLVDHTRKLRFASLQAGGLNDAVWIVSVAIGAAAVMALVRWSPPLPLLAYGLAAAALAACSYEVGLRPRMLLGAFPVLLAPAVVLPPRAYRALLATSALALVALSVLSFGTLAVFP